MKTIHKYQNTRNFVISRALAKQILHDVDTSKLLNSQLSDLLNTRYARYTVVEKIRISQDELNDKGIWLFANIETLEEYEIIKKISNT